MLDGAKRQEIEQSLASLGELLPRSWRVLFDGCKNEGFTPEQSMDLLKTYILSQNSCGIRPPNDGTAQ